MRTDPAIDGRDIPPSEITSKANYQSFACLSRRGVLQAAGVLTGATSTSPIFASARNISPPIQNLVKNPNFVSAEELTTWNDATSYNNYYEFGLDKGEPQVQAKDFAPFPWNVEIGGECEVKGSFSFAQLIKDIGLEERVYRHRCVEATGSGFSLFRSKRVETLPFNGYARLVADLYAGMDLRANF